MTKGQRLATAAAEKIAAMNTVSEPFTFEMTAADNRFHTQKFRAMPDGTIEMGWVSHHIFSRESMTGLRDWLTEMLAEEDAAQFILDLENDTTKLKGALQ
jgi:hypothetical protein